MSENGVHRQLLSIRVWLSLCATVALTFSLAVALGPLEGVAHVSDEVAYTLQARLFANGMRTGAPADFPSMLAYPFWVTHPVSYAAFPPGWPAVLALGEALSLPWLVNPLLAGCLPLLGFGLAREWTDERTGRLTALLIAFSPAIWMLGASRMAHTSVLVALASASLILVRCRDQPVVWAGAGAAIAYMVLARPYDAFLLGIPMLVWGISKAKSHLHRVALCTPVLVALALLSMDNLALTGDPFRFPIRQWADSWYTDKPGCDRLGFGQTIGCLAEAHTIGRALELSWDSVRRLDRSLIGIPGGLILALFGLGLLRKRAAWALLALIGGGYSLYWSPGAAYGARFWHPMLLVLPIGVAVACLRGQDRWAPRTPSWVPGLVLALACTAGGSRVLPDLDDRYWCVDGQVAQHLKSEGISEGVILLQGNGERVHTWSSLDFSLRCDPMLEAGDVLQLMDPTRQQGGLQVRHALENPAEREAFLELYHPGAQAWLLRQDVALDERTIENLYNSEDLEGLEAATSR